MRIYMQWLAIIMATWLPRSGSTQGILNNGAQIITTGSIVVVVTDGGLKNDGIVRFGTNGGLQLGGNAPTINSQLGGTGATTLDALSISKNANNVQLIGDILVNGTIYLSPSFGNLELNNRILTLGPSGDIGSETETARVTGVNGGFVVITNDLNVPVSRNPGRMGIEITSPLNLGSTVITRSHVRSTRGIDRYFTIQPTNTSAANATIRLHYFDAELGATPETNLRMYNTADGGTTWKPTGTGTADAAANYVEVAGINNLAQTFTIDALNRQAQMITPRSYTLTKTYGDAPFDLNAMASSGLPVSYTVADASIATVSSTGAVTILRPGNTIITASQAGDANWLPAQDVAYTLVVNKANQTINGYGDIRKMPADAPFGLTAIASSGLPVRYSITDASIASISGATVTLTGKRGATRITASQPGNAFYTAAPDVSFSLTVGKLPQTITFPIVDHVIASYYPVPLQARSTSGLPVTYRLEFPAAYLAATLNGSILIGMYNYSYVTVIATQDGNDQYDPAPEVRQTFYIVPPSQYASDNLTIFPVPATTKVNVRTQHIEKLDYEVYSLSGALVQKGNIANPAAGTISVSGLPGGAYIILFKTEFGQVSRKVIVVR